MCHFLVGCDNREMLVERHSVIHSWVATMIVPVALVSDFEQEYSVNTFLPRVKPKFCPVDGSLAGVTDFECCVRI